jgi:hypothetical protein
MGDTSISLEAANALMDKWEAEEQAKAAGETPEAKKKKEKKDKIKEGVRAVGKSGTATQRQLDALEGEDFER